MKCSPIRCQEILQIQNTETKRGIYSMLLRNTTFKIWENDLNEQYHNGKLWPTGNHTENLIERDYVGFGGLRIRGFHNVKSHEQPKPMSRIKLKMKGREG